MTDTVLVDARGAARSVASLGMKCDSKEIPELASGAKPTGWWLAERCRFEGRAASGGETGTPGGPTETVLQGTAAIVVGEGRLIGILSPNSDAEPALWWAWPMTSVQIQTAGSQGFLKKRPTEITLKASDRTFQLADVSRLYRHSGRYQTGQETSFLKALGQ